MAEIESEIDADWCKPPEGFNTELDNDEEDNVKFGMQSFDRLTSSLGDTRMLEIFSMLLNETIKETDWRYKHAFLMSVS